MAGIYFHIPFCKRICAYCDFFRSADLRLREPLLQAMHGELEARATHLTDHTIRTIYFGGGTPSLCSPESLQELINHARRLYGFEQLNEITVECNPDDLTDDYLARLRRSEINRLSIGIQSFDDDCLQLMNRRHTSTQAIDAVRRAQQAGFDNITIDLIFGVEGFGGESLRQTLATALRLQVQHISAYHLTIEPDTTLGRRVAQGTFQAVDELISEREFATVHNTLTAAGFEHYEVSNYALPGHRARHNSAYWTGEQYLGIGPGAHTFNGVERSWCEIPIEHYIAGATYNLETLTERDHSNECVMTSLRRSEGIDLEAFASRFGHQQRLRVLRDAQSLIASGTLCHEQGHLRIPAEKFLLSDAVISVFFDA